MHMSFSKKPSNMYDFLCVCFRKPEKALDKIKFHGFRKDYLPQSNTDHFPTKRTSAFAFRERASFSIEAAVCLSLFLFAGLSLLSFAEMIQVQTKMMVPLKNTCSKLAQDAFIYEIFGQDGVDTGEWKQFLLSGVGQLTAKQLFLQEADRDALDRSCIVDGSRGIHFSCSGLPDEAQYMDLIAEYETKLPFSFWPFSTCKVVQRIRIHAWTGEKAFAGDESIQYVYLTKTGTVYHLTLECRHLNIHLRKASLQTVAALRNRDGAKYYPCRICGAKGASGTVFITDYGTAYHSSESCPEITRNIRKVPISEVVGMPVCKTCEEEGLCGA